MQYLIESLLHYVLPTLFVFLIILLIGLRAYVNHLYTASDRNISLGRPESAVRFYKRGIKLSKYVSKPMYLKFQIILARVHISKKDFETATRLLLGVKKTAEAANLLEPLGLAYIYLGIIERRRGNIEGALDNYLISIKYLKQIKNRKRLATAYNNIAIVYQYLGELDKALEYFQMCAKIVSEEKMDELASKVFSNIAMILKEKGKFHEAMNYLTACIDVSKKINDNIRANAAMMGMGIIYQILGQYSKAEDQYLKALALAKDADDGEGVVFILINLIQLHIYKGMLEDAKQYAEKLRYYSEKYDIQIPYVPLIFASLAIEHKDFEDAEKYLKEAEALCEKTKDYIACTHISLTRIEYLIRTKQFEKAQNMLNPLIKRFKEKDQGEFLLNSHFLLAELSLEWVTRDEHKSVDKAREHIIFAIEYATKKNHIPLLIKSSSALAQIEAYTLNFERAKEILLFAKKEIAGKNYEFLEREINFQMRTIQEQEKACKLYMSAAKENTENKNLKDIRGQILEQAKDYIKEAKNLFNT